jgi:hypothetical protein
MKGALVRCSDTAQATTTEWATATRKEQQHFATKHSMMGQQIFQKWPSHWQTRTKPHQQKQHHPNDETVPMDIDIVCRATTEQEKIEHCKAGQCFKRSKQGHMASHCPNKK